MNRTLVNMARSMMFFKNEKLMFWCDAVVCETYLRNRIPSHAIEDKTSHEMWFGHLPSQFFWFHLLCLDTKGENKQT